MRGGSAMYFGMVPWYHFRPLEGRILNLCGEFQRGGAERNMPGSRRAVHRDGRSKARRHESRIRRVVAQPSYSR